MVVSAEALNLQIVTNLHCSKRGEGGIEHR
jgi:hypothetical protein